MPKKSKKKLKALSAARSVSTVSIPKATKPASPPRPMAATTATLDSDRETPTSASDPVYMTTGSTAPEWDDDALYKMGTALAPLTKAFVAGHFNQQRRQVPNAKALPSLTMTAPSESAMLTLLRECLETTPALLVQASLPVQHCIDSDQRLFRTLYRVYAILEAHGFRAEHIQAAMAATGGLHVQDCIDWLCIQLTFDDLPKGFCDKYIADLKIKPREFAPQEPESAGSPNLLPSLAVSPSASPVVSPAVSAELTAEIPVEEEVLSSPALDVDPALLTSDEEDNEFDINVKHAHARIALVRCQRKLREAQALKAVTAQMQLEHAIQRWDSKLKTYEDDYLFNRRAAQALFHEQKKASMDDDSDGTGDTGQIMAKLSLGKKRKKPRPKAIEPKVLGEMAKPAKSPSDALLSADEDFGLLGGMYLEPDIQAEVQSAPVIPTSYTMLDVAHPLWTGVTAPQLLQEVCRAQVKTAKVTFQHTPGLPPGVHQASVAIRWDGQAKKPSPNIYVRDSVYFHSSAEAEAYVATWALYRLAPAAYKQRLASPLRAEWQAWEQAAQDQQAQEHRAQVLPCYRFIYRRLRALRESTPSPFSPALTPTLTMLPDQVQGHPPTNSLALPTPTVGVNSPPEARWHQQLQEQARTLATRRAHPQFVPIHMLKNELPAGVFRETICQVVRENPMVIIRGETGCGKSTQIPQFLIEDILARSPATPHHVICTQPRRISAMAIAQRVSEEFGEPQAPAPTVGTAASLVGYQIRMDSRSHPRNLLTFCTTGVLLKRLETDRQLQGITHIVLDEVQERTLESDFLMLVLRDLVTQQRPDLRLILMSATIDRTLFSRYFDNCPIIEIPGRTFPVTAFYLEDTVRLTRYQPPPNSPYCVRQTTKLARAKAQGRQVRLKDKGGKKYDLWLGWDDGDVQSLMATSSWSATNRQIAGDKPLGPAETIIPVSAPVADPDSADATATDSDGSEGEVADDDFVDQVDDHPDPDAADTLALSPRLSGRIDLNRTQVTLPSAASPSAPLNELLINYDLIVHLLHSLCGRSPVKPLVQDPTIAATQSGAILIFMPGMAQIRRLHTLLMSDEWFGDSKRFIIYPLHSTMSPQEQQAVFKVPERTSGIRKVVIATNIAETGITIPDCTVVIDTGRAKQQRYHPMRRVTRIEEHFVAQANAQQRRGRAGRVQPGVCFHLFSTVRFQAMPEFETPEIARLPLDNLCLRAVVYGYHDVAGCLQRALTPPKPKTVAEAIALLQNTGAIITMTKEASDAWLWEEPTAAASDNAPLLSKPQSATAATGQSAAFSADDFFAPSPAPRASAQLYQLTPLGRHLCRLPVDVYLGRMILYGALLQCLDPMLTIAAALSSKSPFVTPMDKQTEARAAHARLAAASTAGRRSDFLTLYYVYKIWREEWQQQPRRAQRFCFQHYLSHTNLLVIEQMKRQYLALLVDMGFVDRTALPRPSATMPRAVQQALCLVPPQLDQHSDRAAVVHAALVAGLHPQVLYFSDRVHHPHHRPTNASDNKPPPVRAIYLDHSASRSKEVMIHPSSVNSEYIPARVAVGGDNEQWVGDAHSPSPWMVYYNLMETAYHRVYAWETAQITAHPIALFGQAVPDYNPVLHTMAVDERSSFNCSPRTASFLRVFKRVFDGILVKVLDNPTAQLSNDQAQALDTLADVLTLETL
ncbi:hypothetical protein H4R35_000971 [Dimargaris xerosporica]|nr:hypothetical protein H4R35_000971 [Dimargaris xerosporica]